RVMRTYLDEVAKPTPEARLLAARAEAGWGGWDAVHALLDEVPNLELVGDGIGLYLLGRARDGRGDADGAVKAYRAFLASPEDGLALERDAAEMRLGLALVRAGDRGAARPHLQAAAERLGNAAPWLALAEADALADAGDTEAVRQAVAGYTGGLHGLRAWRARIKAARAAGDLEAARRLAVQARTWASTNT